MKTVHGQTTRCPQLLRNTIPQAPPQVVATDSGVQHWPLASQVPPSAAQSRQAAPPMPQASSRVPRSQAVPSVPPQQPVGQLCAS
ncbi:MAG TPA: hypothetical protein VFI22_19515, partial [Thermomicrobiales bacterium]|nr:hypothetical protein [Thermomicrobiales bacterium]